MGLNQNDHRCKNYVRKTSAIVGRLSYMTSYSRLLIFSAIIGFGFVGCTSDETVLFEIPLETDFILAPNDGTTFNTFETFYFPLTRIPTNIGALAGANDSNSIEAIRPSRALLTAPLENFDWSIVDRVVINAISIKDPDIRTEIFYQEQISFSQQNELKLFSSTTEVKNILLEESINLEVGFRFRNVTAVGIRTRLNMNFLAYGTQ